MLAAAVGGVGESLLAWIWAPALMIAVAIGLGLLTERVARVRLPPVLLAPLGVCLVVVLTMPVYRASLSAWVALPLVAALGATGFWLARGDLRTRLRPGAGAAAGFGVYLLYLAPVLLAGGWTWTGYNFVNDTAVQLVLGDRLMTTGAQLPPTGEAVIGSSAYLEFVRSYLATDYPLGSHALLATMARGLPAPLAAAYQPLGALLAALAAMSLTALVARDLGGARRAALVGGAALTANLAYAYALQGNVKEIALLMTIAVAAALGREALTGEGLARHVALVGIALAAALHVYSAAAVPYVGVFVLVLLVAVLVERRGSLRRDLPRALAVGLATVAAGGAVSLVDIVHFGQVAQGTFSGAKAASAGTDEFGQLLRPLRFGQVSGVWLDYDYRLPVRAERRGVNSSLIGLSFGLAIIGLALLLWRRRWGALLFAAPVLLVIPLVAPRVSSYAAGKTLAIGSTGSLLLTGMGVALLWPLLAGVRRGAPAFLGAAAVAVVGATLFSDLHTFRFTQLAPIDRMEAMGDIEERYPGRRILFNEQEEYAKVFLADTEVNVAMETVGAQPLYPQLLVGTLDRRAELDQFPVDVLNSYPVLVQRKAADMARAPTNYRLSYENEEYRVWEQAPGVPRPVARLPLLGLYQSAGVADCAEVSTLAGGARPGDRVVAATAPDEVRVEIADVEHSAGWMTHRYIPGVLELHSPGQMSATVDVPAGTYEAWLQASTGRELKLEVDGRHVGTARGIENIGYWLSAGRIELAAGPHRVVVQRPNGRVLPGDRAPTILGPVVFRRVDQPVRLVTTTPAQAAERLCGKRWDWIELVR